MNTELLHLRQFNLEQSALFLLLYYFLKHWISSTTRNVLLVEGHGVRMTEYSSSSCTTELHAVCDKNGFIKSTRLFLLERIQLLISAEDSSTESFKRVC